MGGVLALSIWPRGGGGGGSVNDALNGTHLNGDTVYLGGALLEDTTIDGGENFSTYFNSSTGFAVNPTVQINNTSSDGVALLSTGPTYGVWGRTVNGVGVFGSADNSGTALSGTSVNGIGVYSFSNNSYAGQFSVQPPTADAVVPILFLERSSDSASSSPGVGLSIDFSLETGSGVTNPAGNIEVTLSDVTEGAVNSDLSLYNINTGVKQKVFVALSTGQLRGPNYGDGAFIDTPVYMLGVTADGRLIEVPIP